MRNLDTIDIVGYILAYVLLSGPIGALFLMGLFDFGNLLIYAKHMSVEGFKIVGLFGYCLGVIFSFTMDNY